MSVLKKLISGEELTTERIIVVKNNTSYAVDIWKVNSNFKAQAQQLYVREYRIGFCCGKITREEAINDAIGNLIVNYKTI